MGIPPPAVAEAEAVGAVERVVVVRSVEAADHDSAVEMATGMGVGGGRGEDGEASYGHEGRSEQRLSMCHAETSLVHASKKGATVVPRDRTPCNPCVCHVIARAARAAARAPGVSWRRHRRPCGWTSPRWWSRGRP